MVALNGPGWRLARSLVTLDAQVDARWPGRDHASDGTIGDLAHQREGAPTYDGAGFGISGSDHDPDNLGIVCALDIDSGPGIDAQALVDAITAEPDPRIAYVIWNRQIFSSRSGSSPWAWRAYGGSDPHTNHVHVSVRHGAVGDNGAPWQIDSNPTPPAPTPAGGTTMARMVAHSDGGHALITLNDIGGGIGDQLIAEGCTPWDATPDGKVAPTVFRLSSPVSEIVASADGHGILCRFVDGHFDVAGVQHGTVR